MKTIEYKEYIITISDDPYPADPREWDNLGTMYFLHSKYTFGDPHSLSIDEINELETNDNYISLPVYIYDHGNITIKTSPFSCLFDSGKIGIIAVSLDKIKDEQLLDKSVTQIQNYLDQEIKTYDKYLRGEAYRYIVTNKNNEIVDKCAGYESVEDAVSEAKSLINYLDTKTPKQLELPFNKGITIYE